MFFSDWKIPFVDNFDLTLLQVFIEPKFVQSMCLLVICNKYETHDISTFGEKQELSPVVESKWSHVKETDVCPSCVLVGRKSE